jgi:hypothetical protein
MESTLLHSFLKSSKIKRWLSDPDHPAALREIKSIFDSFYAPNSMDGRNSEDVDEHEHIRQKLSGNKIPCDLRPLLTRSSMESEITLRARFKHQDVVLSTSQTHQGNSQVYFYPNGNTKVAPIPGFIEYIYTEAAKPDAVSFAVRCATPVNRDVPDPYSKYRHWVAKLYLSSSEVSCVQVQPDWIHCQFARWNCNTETMVIVSLNRVCLSVYCL